MTIMAFLTWLAMVLAPLVPKPAPQHVADAAAGRRAFGMCVPCHQVTPDGRNTVGPNLFGVMDRKAGAVAGYRYSSALMARAAAGLVWDEAALRAYLADPRKFLPGGSMAFAGIRDAGRMDDMIAYLRTVK